MTMRLDSRSTQRVTVRKVRADALTIDDHVQRRCIPARVTRLADGLDLDGVGVITVSERADGTLAVLDGQHRIRALMENGMGEWEVQCRIYHGLTPRDEAAIFRLLNNTRATSIYDDYKVGLVAQDREWVPIDDAVRRAGLEISDQAADGKIMCVSSLRQVYRSANNGRPGDELVEDTLATALAAWGATTEAVEGNIVAGLGIVLQTYGNELDRAVLVRKLAKFPGGPSGLLGRAKALRDIRPSTIARLVAAVIVATYNTGRRKKLAEL